jgi:hypothetical protein
MWDGPLQDEEFEIAERVWQQGILLVPERIRPTLRGDIFTEPRIARYIRRRFSTRGIVIFRWVWNGWHS